MASPPSSSIPTGAATSTGTSSSAQQSTEDSTRDVIYKLLLAKLMEAQSSSLGGALQQPQPVVDPNANGLQHGLGLVGGGMAPPSSLLSHFGSPPAIGGSNGLSPPSTSTTSLFTSPAPGYSGGTPTTPTREGRIGIKRSSPYAESPPTAPPQPAAAASALATFSTVATSPISAGSNLPNFLLVKITDLRSVERLQSLLASNGFTETRLVLANGEAVQQAPSASTPLAAPPTTQPHAAYYREEDEDMMDMAQDPTLNAHHHQLQQQHELLRGGSFGAYSDIEARRDSLLLSHRLQQVPDVAATEEIADEEEEENVEVVDESTLAALDSSLLTASGGVQTLGAAQFAQLSPPLNANEPPTDIQVAEVRHRSVSRSDNVDNEDVYVKCRLCENRIMNTRLSNLTNHVRRHAKLKQFQCAHCSYEHNEIFKVRTHMTRAHGDTNSAPLDRRSPEMERQWEALMHACFPRNPLLHPQNGGVKEHSASFSHHSSSSNGESSSSGSGGSSSSALFASRASYSPGSSAAASRAAQQAARGRYSPTHTTSPPGPYTCSSCKESVAENCLQAHIREEHGSLLHTMHFYICKECGFKSSQKDRVCLHALNTHDVEDIMQIPVELRPSLALQKLFPEKRVVTNEECEGGHQPHDHHRVDDEDEAAEGNGGTQQQFICQMCQRVLCSTPGAVTHAKKHYPTRQFHCTICLYQAVDEAKVRAHLLTKHMSIDQPINVVDAPMQRGWMDTMESCFPELANSCAAALIGTVPDEIGEDCESDTKRRKMERAAAAAAALAALSASASDAATTSAAPIAAAPSPSTTCHIVRATPAEEEEEIDVV